MPASDYLVLRFPLAEAQQEILIAHLAAGPFNGFVQEADFVEAYLATAAATPAFFDELQALCQRLDCSFTQCLLPDQNWNARWEATFTPVRVGDFVGVRAEFHPPFTGVTHDLLIHPRMAFGTGHHATTWLMMARMEELDIRGQRVFDYGCGTGILAILAQRLGAAAIDAVDIEPAATENTQVNMAANGVPAQAIQLYTGDLSAVPPNRYDLILANINRNVILTSLPALYERLIPGGDILFSGILQQDRALVEQSAEQLGFIPATTMEREGWMLLHYRR